MKIFFATCGEIPQGTPDDQVLRDELVRRGIEVQFKNWRDEKVQWSEAQHVLIRSTWDYHRHLPQFLNWASRIKNLGNSAKLVEWNASKRYLLELHAKGIAIVPSTFTGDANVAIDAIAKYPEAILKPAVSATAELTFRISNFQYSRELVNQVLARGDALVQPFIESIASVGEVSLMYFGGEFSHAVLKLPTKGDFRVQSDFGGTVEPIQITKDLEALAQSCLAAIPHESLYARIDIVDWKIDPQIGEVELIEPQLFFRYSSTAASKLADKIAGLKS